MRQIISDLRSLVSHGGIELARKIKDGVLDDVSLFRRHGGSMLLILWMSTLFFLLSPVFIALLLFPLLGKPHFWAGLVVGVLAVLIFFS